MTFKDRAVGGMSETTEIKDQSEIILLAMKLLDKIIDDPVRSQLYRKHIPMLWDIIGLQRPPTLVRFTTSSKEAK